MRKAKAIYSELKMGSQPPSHAFRQRRKGRGVRKLSRGKKGRLQVCLDFKAVGMRALQLG